jgi:D-alanine-D-alanine ligase
MSKVGLFFGGPGNEAAVSIISATNIVKNFDYKQHSLVLIYWHKDGLFYKLNKIEETKRPAKKKKLEISDFKKHFQVALLMTHGRYGEDGVLQGILESQKLPYSGPGVLSSALCMDKVIFKLLMMGQKIPQLPFFLLDYRLDSKERIKKTITQAKAKLKLPVYVKPANSGSSVGIVKLDNWLNLNKAIKEASLHDHKVILEQGLIRPREIEVAVLGNNDLIISRPGELRLEQDFYDYAEKYEKGRTKIIIPASLEVKQEKDIISLAKRVYQLVDARGLARVDFFLKNNKIYLNEINTLPGFTDISMYPMLMKEKGIKYQTLINKLIELALLK